METTNTTFNGWTNYETWNVALYIQNEYELYKLALANQQYGGYDFLIPALELLMGQTTPDGVRWMDPTINTQELDEMLQDL